MDKAAIAAVYPSAMAAVGGAPIFSLLKFEHFTLNHYHPHSAIKGEMAV